MNGRHHYDMIPMIFVFVFISFFPLFHSSRRVSCSSFFGAVSIGFDLAGSDLGLGVVLGLGLGLHTLG